jgi:hypothetical protein
MLTHPITGPRAWRAVTIDERRSWNYPLSQRCLTALDETIHQLRSHPRTIAELQVPDTPCAACVPDLQPARATLETGRGFVILEGLAGLPYSLVEQQVVYWLVGQLLGQPVVQNVQGTLLYDVRDTGQDVRYGARFSVTNAGTGYHTDNSFGEHVVDYVGLLCLRTARSGGENKLVSVYSLHNALLSDHCAVLPTLYEPFLFERRGGLRPGDAATVPFPILRWNGDELLCRYLRYWIEAGHDKAAQPLTDAQQRALAVLEHVLTDPELAVELTLRPGDMFFINNRWLLHNRSAFEDHPEPERKRHYVRLWLEKRKGPGNLVNSKPISSIKMQGSFAQEASGKT